MQKRRIPLTRLVTTLAVVLLLVIDIVYSFGQECSKLPYVMNDRDVVLRTPQDCFDMIQILDKEYNNLLEFDTQQINGKLLSGTEIDKTAGIEKNKVDLKLNEILFILDLILNHDNLSLNDYQKAIVAKIDYLKITDETTECKEIREFIRSLDSAILDKQFLRTLWIDYLDLQFTRAKFCCNQVVYQKAKDNINQEISKYGKDIPEDVLSLITHILWAERYQDDFEDVENYYRSIILNTNDKKVINNYIEEIIRLYQERTERKLEEQRLEMEKEGIGGVF